MWVDGAGAYNANASGPGFLSDSLRKRLEDAGYAINTADQLPSLDELTRLITVDLAGLWLAPSRVRAMFPAPAAPQAATAPTAGATAAAQPSMRAQRLPRRNNSRVTEVVLISDSSSEAGSDNEDIRGGIKAGDNMADGSSAVKIDGGASAVRAQLAPVADADNDKNAKNSAADVKPVDMKPTAADQKPAAVAGYMTDAAVPADFRSATSASAFGPALPPSSAAAASAAVTLTATAAVAAADADAGDDTDAALRPALLRSVLQLTIEAAKTISALNWGERSTPTTELLQRAMSSSHNRAGPLPAAALTGTAALLRALRERSAPGEPLYVALESAPAEAVARTLFLLQRARLARHVVRILNAALLDGEWARLEPAATTPAREAKFELTTDCPAELFLTLWSDVMTVLAQARWLDHPPPAARPQSLPLPAVGDVLPAWMELPAQPSPTPTMLWHEKERQRGEFSVRFPLPPAVLARIVQTERALLADDARANADANAHAHANSSSSFRASVSASASARASDDSGAGSGALQPSALSSTLTMQGQTPIYGVAPVTFYDLLGADGDAPGCYESWPRALLRQLNVSQQQQED